MKKNKKDRINPLFYQHDYHVLRILYQKLLYLKDKYISDKNLIIVDYGCGDAPYRKLFEALANTYIGIDIQKGTSVNIVTFEGQKIKLPDEYCDVVISTQVLEHVKNVDFYLKESNRILKKGGLLILSTHGIWPYHPYPQDYRRWTKKGLETEIIEKKFKLLESISLQNPLTSIVQFKLVFIAERLVKKGIFWGVVLKLISISANIIIFLLEKLFQNESDLDSTVYLICARKR